MGIIQQNSGLFNGASFTPTLGATTSTSNTVYLIVAGNTIVNTPASWSLRTSQVNNMGHYAWSRTSVALTSVAVTNTSGQGVWWMFEVNGAYDTSSSANLTNAGTTYNTPNLTPSAGTRTVIASIGSLHPSATRTLSGWTNSFVEQIDACVTTNDRPLQGGAALIDITANGSTSYSTTATYSTSNDSRSAIILSSASSSGGGGVTGVVAATGPAPTVAIAGTTSVTGAVAATGPTPTAAVTGQTSVTGAASATGPAPAAAIVGAVQVAGMVAATGPVPTVAAAGSTTITGALSAIGPAPSAAAAGTVAVTGAVAAVGPTPQVAISGNVGSTSSGVVAAVGPTPTVSITGAASVVGHVAATGPTPAASIAVQARVTGAVASTGPVPQASISGAVGSVSQGVVAATGPAPAVAVVGQLSVAGLVGASGPAPAVVVVGEVRVAGVFAGVGPIPVVSIVGLAVAVGDASPVMFPRLTLTIPTAAAVLTIPTSAAVLAVPTCRAETPTMSYTRNDTGPDLVATLNSTPQIAFTGAVVAVHLRKPSGTTVTIPSGQVVFDPVGRTVTVSWATGDLNEAGAHRLEVQVTYSNGKVQTFHADDFHVAHELA